LAQLALNKASPSAAFTAFPKENKKRKRILAKELLIIFL
jgi:hypothetical protein